MITNSSVTDTKTENINIENKQLQAYNYFIKNNYADAILIYQELTESFPNNKEHYCYLGLCQLLQEKENVAQTIWLSMIEDDNEDSLEENTRLLSLILEKEAKNKFALENFSETLSICQNLSDIDPYNLTNSVLFIRALIKTDKFSTEDIANIGILNLIESGEFESLDLSSRLRD